MRKVTVSALALCAVLAMSEPARAETALSNNHVVMDKNRNIVHAYRNGSCVRTKWEAGEDACGPPVAAAVPPKPTVTTRTELSEVERSVYFAFDRSELTPEAQSRLDGVSNRLKSADDVARASIVGYADRIGSDDYNQRLSLRRAEAVKAYLIQRGYLNVDVAELQGRGESRPVTDCGEETARDAKITCLSPDRRVDIHLTYNNRAQVSSNR